MKKNSLLFIVHSGLDGNIGAGMNFCPDIKNKNYLIIR